MNCESDTIIQYLSSFSKRLLSIEQKSNLLFTTNPLDNTFFDLSLSPTSPLFFQVASQSVLPGTYLCNFNLFLYFENINPTPSTFNNIELQLYTYIGTDSNGGLDQNVLGVSTWSSTGFYGFPGNSTPNMISNSQTVTVLSPSQIYFNFVCTYFGTTGILRVNQNSNAETAHTSSATTLKIA